MAARLFLLLLAATLVPAIGIAQDTGPEPGETLTIFAATDRANFEPILANFQAHNPGIGIEYHELQSLELYDLFLSRLGQSRGVPDLVVSSAIDLQFKLVNDGHALSYDSSASRQLPGWAVWRDEAFGFTFEPAVVVYNKALVEKQDVPQSRAELRQLLLTHSSRFSGRIGTYDPANSGVGYLFATQDAEQSPGFWELVHSLGVCRVKLHQTTAEVLDRIAVGEYLLGYNLLGSYAHSRAELEPQLGIILPRDYTLVLSRMAFIPRKAPNPELSKRFLDFLLSAQGQSVIATETGLAAIHPGVEAPRTATQLQIMVANALRPIGFDPGLLVYLDQLKRHKFLSRWQRVLGGGS